jgi:hypothetical protein
MQLTPCFIRPRAKAGIDAPGNAFNTESEGQTRRVAVSIGPLSYSKAFINLTSDLVCSGSLCSTPDKLECHVATFTGGCVFWTSHCLFGGLLAS